MACSQSSHTLKLLLTIKLIFKISLYTIMPILSQAILASITLKMKLGFLMSLTVMNWEMTRLKQQVKLITTLLDFHY